MKPVFRNKNNNLINLFVITIIASLGFLILYNSALNPNVEIKSRDGLAHLMNVKMISVNEKFPYFEKYFWESNFKYMPLFYGFGVGLEKITGINDFILLGKIMIFIQFFLFFLIFYLFLKKITKNNLKIIIGLLILILSYFFLRRFSALYPENLSLIYLLILFITLDLKNKKRILLSIILVVIINLTNVLATTLLFSSLLLLIPVKILTNKTRDIISIIAILALGLAISLPFFLIINQNFFWFKYITKIIYLTLGISIFAVIWKKIKNNNIKQVVTPIILTTLFIFATVFISNKKILNFFLSDKYLDPNEFIGNIINNFLFYFVEFNNHPIRIDVVVTFFMILGLICFIKSKNKATSGIIAALIVFLSFFTVLIGPYFNIDPLLNTPRGIIYCSIFGIVFAMSAYFKIPKKFIIVTTFVIVVTNLPQAIAIANSHISYNPPYSIIQYINKNIKPEEFIFTDNLTLSSIYLKEDNLSHLLNTPNVKKKDIINTNNPDLFKENNIKYIITSPVMEIDNKIIKKKFKSVHEADKFTILKRKN